jgi:hypothetical protein
MHNYKVFEKIINPALSSIINNTSYLGINKRITNVLFSFRTTALPTHQFLSHCSRRVTEQLIDNPPTKGLCHYYYLWE